MKIEIYKSGLLNLSWKWRLLDEDNDILGYGRGFNRKQNVQRSIDTIKDLINEPKYPQSYEVYLSGRFRRSWKWRMKSVNGRILASDRGFLSEEECYESLNKFKEFFKNKHNK